MVEFKVITTDMFSSRDRNRLRNVQSHVGEGLEKESEEQLRKIAEHQLQQMGHHHADGSPVRLELQNHPFAKEWEEGLAKKVGEASPTQSPVHESSLNSSYTSGAMGGQARQSQSADYNSGVAPQHSQSAANFGCACGEMISVLLGGAVAKDPTHKTGPQTEYTKSQSSGVGPATSYQGGGGASSGYGGRSGYEG